MESIRKHIFPFIAVLLLISCQRDEAEIIPRAKLAEIYAEMLLTDQWISSTPGARMIADTSLVYEPILQKYGYDKLDYVKSVDHYMNDPERFSRILRTTSEKLEKRLQHLKRLQKRQKFDEELKNRVLKHQTNYAFEEYFPYLADEPYVHYYDSVTFEPDTLYIYRLIPIETSDTLYDRIEMIVRTDSLSVNDTLAVCDSIAPRDSVVVPSDTLKIDKIRKIVDVKGRDTMGLKMNTWRAKKWPEKE